MFATWNNYNWIKKVGFKYSSAVLACKIKSWTLSIHDNINRKKKFYRLIGIKDDEISF